MKSWRWGPNLIGVLFLQEKEKTPAILLSLLHEYKEEAMWGHREKVILTTFHKMSFYKKIRMKFLPETSLHDTFILDF